MRDLGTAKSQKESVFALMHDLSQPLTSLECGLELGLRHDKTAADFRQRMRTLLELTRQLRHTLVVTRERLNDGGAEGSDKRSRAAHGQ